MVAQRLIEDPSPLQWAAKVVWKVGQADGEDAKVGSNEFYGMLIEPTRFIRTLSSRK